MTLIGTSFRKIIPTLGVLGIFLYGATPAFSLGYEEYPSIRLRALDKITARTLTFDAQVGNTVKFGDIYIKILSCRKPPPVEKTESAAFLQVWQIDKTDNQPRWVFSGWMFSSSPALSAMDHPVYDVWVIDCLGKDPEELPKETAPTDKALPDEGTIPEGSVAQPDETPDQQKQKEPNKDSTGPSPAANSSSAVEETPEDVVPQKAEPAPAEAPAQGDNFNGIY